MCDKRCVVPPAPELEQKIIRSKQLFQAGRALPAPGEYSVDLLDMRTFTLIMTRPKKTRQHTFVSPTREFAPTVGTRRALVLLVDFSDKTATLSQNHYENLLFSLGTHSGGSMRDYYREVSYQKLDVTGVVSGAGGPTAGWFRVPQPKSYYADGNFGFNEYPRNAQKLVEDAIDLASPVVNFANYDNDGDGFVEALVVVCAGSGAEQTGDVNDLWSHKWSITPKHVDGVTINRYFMAPEDGRVGVMAHELGHLLMGWPDLYDTDQSSAGTGKWDLMAGGSWNNGGDTPAHPTAWCKAKAGWVNPTVIQNTSQDVTITPYAQTPSVYKLPVGDANSKEYFLVSNRQQVGFDQHLPGSGCIIEHVDDNQTNNTDEDHYLVDIEQADGRRDLNKNANRGDDTDPFPTASNNEFTATSTPNSKSYDGTDSRVAVTNIQKTGGDIKATLSVGGQGPSGGKQWINNVSVVATYASVDSMNAWAYIEPQGWRRIKQDATDGVTEMFEALSEARANDRSVNIYADEDFIYAVVQS